MKYVTFETGGEEFKLRLGTQQIVELEKQLGGSLLKILTNDPLLPLNTLISILKGSLVQYHHGYNMEKTFAMYDQMLEEGKTYMDLTAVIIDVLRVSGFFSANQEVETPLVQE